MRAVGPHADSARAQSDSSPAAQNDKAKRDLVTLQCGNSHAKGCSLAYTREARSFTSFRTTKGERVARTRPQRGNGVILRLRRRMTTRSGSSGAKTDHQPPEADF